MGRTSSTLSSFLVARSDSSKYAYQRKLPPDLRPLAAGTISLSSKARLLDLEVPTTIKISLGTGDLPTAKTRCDAIHVQVDDARTPSSGAPAGKVGGDRGKAMKRASTARTRRSTPLLNMGA